jgi:plastocyanin
MPGRSRWWLRPLLGAAASALLAAGAAGCGDDDGSVDSGDAPATDSAGDPADDAYGDRGSGDIAGDAAVTAAGFEFTTSPVEAGAEVTFSNEDSTTHTMTADDGSFDSGDVVAGESATITAPSEPGDHAFHCEIHPSMEATLTVE